MVALYNEDMIKKLIGAVIVLGLVGGGWYAYQASRIASPVETTQAAGSDYHDNIYLTKGMGNESYMADFEGMTLYTFDRDTADTSNCTGNCAQTWRPYTSGASAQQTFPAGISLITRTDDNSKQFTWHNKPLYYFTKDKVIGDKKGDNVGGMWHIVKLQ